MIEASPSVLRNVNRLLELGTSIQAPFEQEGGTFCFISEGVLPGACVEGESAKGKRAPGWQAAELRKASRAGETPARRGKGSGLCGPCGGAGAASPRKGAPLLSQCDLSSAV